MSARRNFLRNITMAIAASLVPRILQPSMPEIMEEEMVEVRVEWKVYILSEGQLLQAEAKAYRDDDHIIKMKLSEYELVKNKVL